LLKLAGQKNPLGFGSRIQAEDRPAIYTGYDHRLRAGDVDPVQSFSSVFLGLGFSVSPVSMQVCRIKNK
jgi:hypothetical protein